MRATYEDLLRTARRIAVSAQRGSYPDEVEVMGDWQAVLSATKHHLHWLRGRLRTSSRGEPEASGRSDNALGRLAQAIGAGADVLALQDAAAAAAFEVRGDLTAARAEVAAVALMAATAVVRNTNGRTRGRAHLRRVMAELDDIARSDVRRSGLGGLGVLAVGGPAAPVESLSTIAAAAARWERVHAAVSPEIVLTRDMRSTTAQLRAVAGAVHAMTGFLLSTQSAELEIREREALTEVRSALAGFESGARGVQQAWRRRVSDLSGLSELPGEAAYLDLKWTIDRALRDGLGLRQPAAGRSILRLIDSVDELLWAAKQVAGHQLSTVSWLIGAGRLFVPRHEAVRVDIYYLRRPSGGSRPMQARWVLTDNPGCFDELVAHLNSSANDLEVASEAVRRIAGTSGLSRRSAEVVTRIPQPYLDEAYRIGDPGREFAAPGR